MDISQDFDNQYSRQKTQQKQSDNFQSPNYSKANKFTQQQQEPKKQIQQNQAKQNQKLADWVWPNGTIPYIIDKSFTDPMKQKLKLAIQEFEDKTPIRFLQISDDSSYNQYVKYYRNEKKSSYAWVGRSLLKKEHEVYINDQFPYGTYLHETMHVLGFRHEQCRKDRDDYVSVQFSKNDSSRLKDQYKKKGYMIGEYDPDSIMHYPLGENMKSKDQQQQQRFGQRQQLSQGDIQGIQFIYGKSLAK